MRIPRSKWLWLATFLVLVIATWLGLSGAAVWEMTRRQEPVRSEPPPHVTWGTLEPLRLDTSDGESLGAWLVRGKPSGACVVLLHGLDNCRAEMLPIMQFLAGKETTCMAIDLRAHGDSTGDSLDFGYSSRLDVVAAVEFLEDEFPTQPVFVLGRSMGAAAALFAAEELGERVHGYFLEAPYKDLGSEAWKRVQRDLPPVVDTIAYAGMWISAHAILPASPGRISPRDHARHVPQEVPIVLVTGSNDGQLPPEEVRTVFEPVRSHAAFVVFEGAGHADLHEHDSARYETLLLDLITD